MAQTKLGAFLKRIDATQEQCAAGAGVDQSTISKMVNGRGSPKAETVARVFSWCDAQARRRRIPQRERLEWIDLVGRPAPKPEAAA